MEGNLLSIDSKFSNQYKGLFDIQFVIAQELKVYKFDLSKEEITDAIVERMNAFWYFNVNNNKAILDREINTTSADFFTETFLLFVKSYFEQIEGVKVYSERTIKIHESVIKPDISIWFEKILIAVIELKVSDGWKGKTMLPHLIEREKLILETYPNCIFGVVGFWNFFDSTIDGWGTKYIGIKRFNEAEMHPRTNEKVESLLLLIDTELQKLRKK